MCIIVAKDKFSKLPKEEYLKNCFTNNPDGAGFMYTDHDNNVVIDKGYMTYKSFLKRYKKLCKRYNDFVNKALIMHFRIGTAGANSRENCHPYPVTYDKDKLHKLYTTTSLGVVHNGIISEYNPPKEDKTTNDTQNFIMKYIYPIYKHYPKFYKNQYIMNGLEDITNSKFAFLDKCDNIYLVGDFKTDDNGVKYSNSNYLPATTYSLKNYGYYGYDYYSQYYDYYKDYDTKYRDEYPLATTHDTNTPKKDSDYLKYEMEYDSEIILKPTWWYSVEGKNFERVKEQNLVYDYVYDILYELTNTGEYEYLGRDVLIMDENGEEIIF